MFIPYAFNLTHLPNVQCLHLFCILAGLPPLCLWRYLQIASMSARFHVDFRLFAFRLVFLLLPSDTRGSSSANQWSSLLFQAGIEVYLYAAVYSLISIRTDAHLRLQSLNSEVVRRISLCYVKPALILPMVSVSVSRVFRVSLIANSRLWVRCFCGGGFSIVLRYLLNLVYTSY